MNSQCLQSFISHRVASHARSATRIKEILESRSERIFVQISENTPAGEKWEPWITRKIEGSKLMIVLLPEVEGGLTWIEREVRLFKSHCPDGRLVVFKPLSVSIPDFLSDRQVIDGEAAQIRQHFLEPLFYQKQFTRLTEPLNPRMSPAEIQRDAAELEEAVLGLIDPQTKAYVKTLIVEIKDSQKLGESRIVSDSTVVRATSGCDSILNWTRDHFTWAELRTHAELEKGKGTFWIEEMQEVMAEVASCTIPRAMTSTFRGRGEDAAGKIYGPQLHHVCFVDGTPFQYHFDLHEVLVPELVRGPGKIGKVFNLLHVALRGRWEVLNPYLKLQTSQSALPLEEGEKAEMISKVRGSLRIIEMEANRHNILDEDNVEDVFEGEDQTLVLQMIKDRKAIRDRILSANEPNFPGLMNELKLALMLNVQVTVLLADRFLALAKDDQDEIKTMVEKLVNNPEEEGHD